MAIELWPPTYRGYRLEVVETVLDITVLDEPAPTDRPRFNTKTGRVYPTNRNVDKQAAIRRTAMDALPADWVPIDGPVELHVVAWYTAPKSLSAKKRAEALPITKADWDNLGKQIGDSLQKYVIRDDKQIVRGTLVKLYAPDDIPRWDIIINTVRLVRE